MTKRKLTPEGQLKRINDRIGGLVPREPIPPREQAGWRQRVYIQTATHGVFYTPNFVNNIGFPDGVPTWTAINTGLNLAFEGIGFRGDPFDPENRQYSLMVDALYRRESGGNWVSVLTVAQAAAIAGGDPSAVWSAFGVNGLNCNINREGWVGVVFNTTNMAHTQVKLVLLYSTDFGATWNESIIEDWNISARTTTYSLTVGAYKGSSPYDAGQVMYCGVDASPRLAITTDGGATWAYGALLGAGSFVGHVLVDPSDQSRVFVGMRDGVGPWHVVVSLDHGATINDYDTNASENLGYPATAVYYHLSVAMDERKMVRVGARTGLAHIHTTTDDGGTWEEPTPQYSSTSLGISLVQDSPWNLYLLRQLSGDLASVPETCHVVFASNDEGRTMTLKAGANACTIDTGGGDSIPYNCGGVRGILEVWTDLAEAEIEGYPTYHSLGQHPGALSWPQIEGMVGSGAEEVAAGSHVAEEPFDAHLNNPACRAYHSAGQAIGSGAWAALALNSERFDTDGMHDNAVNNSRITFQTAGQYTITGNILWASNAAGAMRGVAIRLNGVTYIAVHMHRRAAIAGGEQISTSTIYEFSATDYVELMAYQDTGGNLSCGSGPNYAPEFAAARIG